MLKFVAYNSSTIFSLCVLGTLFSLSVLLYGETGFSGALWASVGQLVVQTKCI